MSIEFTSKITATLVDSMGTEQSIADAARVSLAGAHKSYKRSFWGLLTGKTKPEPVAAPRDPARLVKRLYAEGHGVPFEHCELVFHMEMPIFTSRQVVKHRLSSVNEISGRYVKLAPKFYVPQAKSHLGQSGKSMDYRRQQLPKGKAKRGIRVLKAHYRLSWAAYTVMQRLGFANEQARAVLPTATYTEMRMKANLRSWLNFISLRVDWGDDAAQRSHPQAEIQELGLQVAEVIQKKFPNVWEAFVASGYRAV